MYREIFQLLPQGSVSGDDKSCVRISCRRKCPQHQHVVLRCHEAPYREPHEMIFQAEFCALRRTRVRIRVKLLNVYPVGQKTQTLLWRGSDSYIPLRSRFAYSCRQGGEPVTEPVSPLAPTRTFNHAVGGAHHNRNLHQYAYGTDQ